MKRIVVKIGSSSLTINEGQCAGQFNKKYIDKIVKELTDLHRQGTQVILVTSGAICAGINKLRLTAKPQTIPEKQAVAAVGQGQLMHLYEEMFAKYDCVVAQVLLTREDMSERSRYLNIRNTLLTLLNYKVIPVINENDTVAIEEIKFGDNDTLSALVASKVEADMLIILSDVAGLYTGDPRRDKKARLIEEVKEITREIEASAGGEGTKYGTGGMFTKLQAAKIATAAGVMTVITDGTKENVLSRIIKGENIGTRFLPKAGKISGRKRWIGFAAKTSGAIIIDEGASVAILKKGKSLLPSGILAVEGKFETGAIVVVRTRDKKDIARGLVSYTAEEINKIKGQKSGRIEELLGWRGYDEVIHRDNLVI
ncbi:MAG: glutamate 5-kinase, partial [bacterium]